MQRKSKFALQDDDEEDVATEVLTHGGTALSTLDDFKEDLSIGDEDEDGACMASLPILKPGHHPYFVRSLLYLFAVVSASSRFSCDS